MRIAIAGLLPDGQDAPALRELHRISRATSVPPHALTGDPEAADLIIFTDPDPARHYESLRRHPWIRRYFEKCFIVFHWHEPHGFLPGIYTETPGGAACWPGTHYRAGLYWPAHHTNPLIRERGAEFAHMRAHEGGVSVARPYLFSFVGRNCHPVRAEILRLPAESGRLRAHIEGTDAYDHWHQDNSAGGPQRRYVDVALQSAFALCPRGLRKPSIRLFEMMQLGVCPVVLADGYKFPDGPDWESFCVVVAERDAARLWEILPPLENEAAERGRLARAAWDAWFAPERQFDYIVDVLEDIQSLRHPKKELRSLRWRWPLRIACVEAAAKLRRLREKFRG